MHIGVAGLGIIGARMAQNWRKHGHEVTGWNRTPERAAGLGLPLVSTPRELAERAEVIMVVVADPPALQRVVSGPDGLCAGSLVGRVVLNSGTVGPADNRAAAQAVEAAGGEFLESPFTGSKTAAERGALVFYIGGEAGLLQRLTPLLLQVGRKIFHFGPVGAGADAKLVMNMMLASLMQAMAEGFTLARKAGLNMNTFVEAYRHNAGWSPLAELKVANMLTGDFSTHFALKHMNKDLRLALDRARELGVDLPQLRRVREVFSAAMEAGLGEEDFSALYRLALEQARLSIH